MRQKKKNNLDLGQSQILRQLEDQEIFIERINEAPHSEAFSRPILARAKPSSVKQVQKLMTLANENGVPIYPFSTGRNWGFGTQVPTDNLSLLVDMSLMNKILEYDSYLGTVSLQPGVTQKQLSDFLKQQGDRYYFDSTGSGEQTSVLGNSLERGVGYKALRHECLLSLSVLLSNGEILQTGYSRFSNSNLYKCHATGVGASLNDFFTQSNFGVVLEATVKLQRRREYTCVLSYPLINDDQLRIHGAILKELLEDEVVTCIPKVADRRRCEQIFCPLYVERSEKAMFRYQVEELFRGIWENRDWSVILHLSGPRSVVEAKKKHIEKKMSVLTEVRTIDESSLAQQSLIFEEKMQQYFDSVIFRYSTGTPSNESLRSLYWDFKDKEEDFQRPEDKGSGVIYMAPLIPNSPEEVQKFLDLTRNVSREFQMSPAMTLNYINSNSVEAVVSFGFRKQNPFEVKKSHNFRRRLQESYMAHGFIPYRLDVASMDEFLECDLEDQREWNSFCQSIKDAVDPKGIVSPGRYLRKKPKTG